IVPAANKAKNVFDSGKTVSFHIKSVVVCQQSQKSSTLQDRRAARQPQQAVRFRGGHAQVRR
ncbi:hypothetical protein ID866_10365, partial [Astraeus odoratus]